MNDNPPYSWHPAEAAQTDDSLVLATNAQGTINAVINTAPTHLVFSNENAIYVSIYLIRAALDHYKLPTELVIDHIKEEVKKI